VLFRRVGLLRDLKHVCLSPTKNISNLTFVLQVNLFHAEKKKVFRTSPEYVRSVRIDIFGCAVVPTPRPRINWYWIAKLTYV